MNPKAKPLCVDLDGTLIKNDTFLQALFQLFRTRPLLLFKLPALTRGGLAAFKRRIAQEIRLDPVVLPYHEELLAFLRAEKANGRELVLATASDALPAGIIAAHTGLFSDVIASDGETNVKRDRKRERLIARYGEKGFAYAGNSLDDLAVWEAADEIIAVNPSVAVRRKLKGRPARFFEDRPSLLNSWVHEMRISQWMKNILIFLPMFLAHRVTEWPLYAAAVVAFLSFSFGASAIYVLNDLLDLHADQHHPRKRRRPFAAGNVNPAYGVFVLPLLLAASLWLASILSAAFLCVLLFYFLTTTLYSWWFKQHALLDVLILAGLYAIRILAGAAATGVEASTWLIAFSIFLFFSLAMVKRYSEFRELTGEAPEAGRERGRGYRVEDLPLLAVFGSISGFMSVLVLALYINSSKVMQFYPNPGALWLLCPLLLYWISRIWLLAYRGELSDDPLDFAAKDPRTWGMAALAGLILLLGSL